MKIEVYNGYLWRYDNGKFAYSKNGVFDWAEISIELASEIMFVTLQNGGDAAAGVLALVS